MKKTFFGSLLLIFGMFAGAKLGEYWWLSHMPPPISPRPNIPSIHVHADEIWSGDLFLGKWVLRRKDATVMIGGVGANTR